METEAKIKKALLSLMEEKSFDKISVTNIVNEAKINRGTFYLHYFDKFDLIESIENEIFNEIEQAIDKSFRINIEMVLNHVSKGLLESVLFNIYSAVEKHIDVIKILLSKNGSISTPYKLNNLFKKQLSKNISMVLKIKKPQIPDDYIMAVASSVHYSIIMEWINKENRESVDELVKIAASIVYPVVTTIVLGRGIKNNK